MTIPDRDRLARAVHLTVTCTGTGAWRVTGGALPHTVTAAADGRLACDCTDAAVHGDIECKHALAIRLEAHADPEMIETLRQLVTPPTRKRKART